MGPLLGIRGPERCVSFPVSFSHRSVGSSILASLSEAGGNDPRKSASKPLPPRFAHFQEPLTETHPTPALSARLAPTSPPYLKSSIRLEIHHLRSTSNVRKSTDLGPEFQIGTETILLRESAPVPMDHHFSRLHFLRSRTSVLSLPIPLRHRFFSAPAAQSTHDRALPTTSSSSSRALVVRVLRRPSSCFSSHPSCGHTRHDPLRSRRHLLLQLLAFQNKTRVRENVRIAAVCFPLVGHNVRKASRHFSTRKSWRRPSLSARRPCRTRQQIAFAPGSSLSSCDLLVISHFGLSPRRTERKARLRVSQTKREAPRNFHGASLYFVLLCVYAAICRVSGTDVFTSIFRGRISAAIGALISITPFTYSACSFSILTPSGSSSTLSNFPYAISFS